MCGIVGVMHYRGGEAGIGQLERQVESMIHRGPDDHGVWAEGGVALGHRRLSIIDPSPGGHQPMCNEDGTLWLTFNGELYGWREIRRGLIERGHRFRGHSDAEIVLHLYEDEGESFTRCLRGEFAFALMDCRARRLLIARDRIGVKPLYYHDDGARLAFASELKALLLDPSTPREVDERAILEYLMFQYVPCPRTSLRHVRKLRPGHLLICDERGVRESSYWTLPDAPVEDRPASEIRERLRELLEDAVRSRMIADVPVGAFLSGGIDSSAVVALMARFSAAPIRTFTVGFEEQDFSELEHARLVSRHLGTEHHEMVVRPRALEILPHLVWGLDEPFADASIIPTYYLSRLAHGHVKTVLSGDGGDEIFAGYRTYGAALSHERRLTQIPMSLRHMIGTAAWGFHGHSSLGRKIRRIPMGVLERHLEAMSGFPPFELNHILSPEWSAIARQMDLLAPSRERYDPVAHRIGRVPALLHFDAGTYLPDDVLKKVDTASMLNSLEVRVPLLDHELLEFAARIPFEHKLRGGVTKWILRKTVEDLLPAPILHRRKKGFTVPLRHWFDGKFGRLARETLLDSRARGRGWLNTKAVERLLNERGPDRGHVGQLWSLVCLELWAQCYLDVAPSLAFH